LAAADSEERTAKQVGEASSDAAAVRAWFAKLGTFLGRFRQRQAGVALYRSATSLVVSKRTTCRWARSSRAAPDDQGPGRPILRRVRGQGAYAVPCSSS
jgi:hypothetical protein